MLRICLLLFLLPLYTSAQQKFNLLLNGGFSNYTGDLQEKKFTLDQSNLAFGIGLSYELLPKLSLRGEFRYGKVSADDKLSSRPELQNRNLNFHSAITEGSLIADYSLFDLQSGKRITPYVFAGIGLFHFNPYTFDRQGDKVFLRNLGTEGQGLAAYPDKKPYGLVQASIPFGAGIRFRVSENAYLGYEIGLRKLFTDYLDDVSTTYADQALLLAGRGQQAVDMAFRTNEIKETELYPPAGAIRGGQRYKDWYYFSSITLSIGLFNNGKVFGKREGRGRIDCPVDVL